MTAAEPMTRFESPLWSAIVALAAIEAERLPRAAEFPMVPAAFSTHLAFAIVPPETVPAALMIPVTIPAIIVTTHAPFPVSSVRRPVGQCRLHGTDRRAQRNGHDGSPHETSSLNIVLYIILLVRASHDAANLVATRVTTGINTDLLSEVPVEFARNRKNRNSLIPVGEPMRPGNSDNSANPRKLRSGGRIADDVDRNTGLA